MWQAQSHLFITHFPTVLSLFAVPLLIIGIFKKKEILSHIALGLFFLIELSTLLSYYSGKAAKTYSKKIPSVDRALVSAHWEAGENLTYLEIGIFLFLVLLLWRIFTPKKIPQWCWILFLILNLFSLYFIFDTAHSGGIIQHYDFFFFDSQ